MAQSNENSISDKDTIEPELGEILQNEHIITYFTANRKRNYLGKEHNIIYNF